MGKETFTVTEINSRIDKILKRNPTLKNICVRGEISNYKSYARGNDYFTLKDEGSQIPVTLYRNYKQFLKFKPENGMKVIIKGSVEGYVKQGEYRLYAYRMKKDGVGDLHRKFEELKEKLKEEGLFDEDHKKPIPKYPERIGVITAETGAAVRDIITTINRRYPICKILLFSTLVQGDYAAPQIVNKIRFSQNFDLDLLIVGRGGGSIEDLWPFNEEIVAREIYSCRTPVISAVGHETDYTITDFVADKRAATPTAAAEIAVPDINELNYKINNFSRRANITIQNKLQQNKKQLNNISEKKIFKHPETIYNIHDMNLDRLISRLESTSAKILSKNKQKLISLEKSSIFKNPEFMYAKKEIKLDNLINKLNYNSKTIIRENKHELAKLENSTILKNPNLITKSKRDNVSRNIDKLEILNPLLTLKRGYTLAKVDGKVISSAKNVKKGDQIDIEFDDGTVNTKVI